MKLDWIKIDDRLNKSSDKYMLFFTNKVLDSLKIERIDNKEIGSEA
ncbi:hypothetical protein [Borreliella afzelii]